MAKRKKRKSRLAGIKIEEKPKKEKEEESKEVDYKKFKTRLGKKWSNYIVIGPIQVTDNWAVQEITERLKEAGQVAIIKARSFEEAFEIYYKHVSNNWTGGINPLMELGLGKIKDFKPKFIHKEDGRVWYYDITTYIQKMKKEKTIEKHTVALLNPKAWFMSSSKLIPEDKRAKLKKLKKKVQKKKVTDQEEEKKKRKRKRKKKGKE